MSSERMSDERLTQISGPGYAGGPYIKPWIAEEYVLLNVAKAWRKHNRSDI